MLSKNNFSKMNKNIDGEKEIIVAADVDISRMGGDVVRIMALANAISNYGYKVKMIVPKKKYDKYVIQPKNINICSINTVQRKGSIINIIKRNIEIIRKVKSMKNQNSILIVEMTLLGAYLSIMNCNNYILDIHGFVFDEIFFNDDNNKTIKKIIKFIIKKLEFISIKNSSKIVVVSESMKRYVLNNIDVSENKIYIVQNGFFPKLVKRYENSIVVPNSISFVGILSKWAKVDIILKLAILLKYENIYFNIIGDGPHKNYLEKIKKENDLSNVRFFGSVPIDKAYNLIASSEIMLLPFSHSTYSKVSCPIKVLEYMAFGKAMIIDNICDISHELEEKQAAISIDTNNINLFASKIKLLLNDKELCHKLSYNAKKISFNYSWDKQGFKMINVIKE